MPTATRNTVETGVTDNFPAIFEIATDISRGKQHAYRRALGAGRAGPSIPKIELSANVLNDSFERLADIFDDRADGLFQRGELTGDEVISGEMMLAVGQIAVELRGGAPQENNFEGEPFGEDIAIGLFQGRASEHDILRVSISAHQLLMNRGKPGSAIRVCKRNSAMHLFFICGGVEIVRIEKNPIEAAGE
jgi:hypothetical protein